MEDIPETGNQEMFAATTPQTEPTYDHVSTFRQEMAAEHFDDNLLPYHSELDLLAPHQPAQETDINPSETSSPTSGPSASAPKADLNGTPKDKGIKPKASSTGKRRGRAKKAGRDAKDSIITNLTADQITEILKQSVDSVKAATPILIKTRALKDPLPDGSFPSLYKYGLITDAYLVEPTNVPGEAQQRLDFVVEVDTVSHKSTKDALSALGVMSVYRSFWNDCRVYAELGNTTRWYPLHEWLTTRVRTGTETVDATLLRQPDEVPKELAEPVKQHLMALPLGANRRKEAGPRRRSPDLAAAEAAKLATEPAPRQRKRPTMTQSEDEYDEPFDSYVPPPPMPQPRPPKQPKLMQQHHHMELQQPQQQLLPLYEGMIPLTMGGIVLHPVGDPTFMQMSAMHMGMPMAVPMAFPFQQHDPHHHHHHQPMPHPHAHPHAHHPHPHHPHVATWGDGTM
jgi:hypothetical protein